MKIVDDDPNRLVLIERNFVHKWFFGLLTVLFGSAAVGMAADEYTSLVVAMIPAAIATFGIAGLVIGGKPDTITLDRTRNLLRVEHYPGSFSRLRETEFRLSDFTALRLDPVSGGSYRTYAIVLLRGEEDPLQVGMSERSERRMTRRMERLAEFLRIPVVQ